MPRVKLQRFSLHIEEGSVILSDRNSDSIQTLQKGILSPSTRSIIDSIFLLTWFISAEFLSLILTYNNRIIARLTRGSSIESQLYSFTRHREMEPLITDS